MKRNHTHKSIATFSNIQLSRGFEALPRQALNCTMRTIENPA